MWRLCGVLLALNCLALTMLCIIRYDTARRPSEPVDGGMASSTQAAAYANEPEAESTPFALPDVVQEPIAEKRWYTTELEFKKLEWEHVCDMFIQAREAKPLETKKKDDMRLMTNQAGEFLRIDPGSVIYVYHDDVLAYGQLFSDVTEGLRYVSPSASTKALKAYAEKGLEQDLSNLNRESAIERAERLVGELLEGSLLEARAEKVTVFSMQQMRDMREALRKASFQAEALADIGAEAVCRVDLRAYIDGTPVYSENLDGVYQARSDGVEWATGMDMTILMTQDRVLMANIAFISEAKGEKREATILSAEEISQRAALSNHETEMLEMKYLTVLMRDGAKAKQVMKPAWRIERQSKEIYFDAETGERI